MIVKELSIVMLIKLALLFGIWKIFFSDKLHVDTSLMKEQMIISSVISKENLRNVE